MAKTPQAPVDDSIDQQTLAGLLGVAPKTASIWAGQGRLKKYEHGNANCGRRKYSRRLVAEDMRLHLDRAINELHASASSTPP